MEDIICLEMSSSIWLDKLAILASRLLGVSISSCKGVGILTKTVPDPQLPDHEPPVNDIQFLCPKGVGPTEIFGFNVTDIRKSRSRLG